MRKKRYATISVAIVLLAIILAFAFTSQRGAALTRESIREASVLQPSQVNYGMHDWTFETMGYNITDIAITQGIQQALFVTLFDNCLVYAYNPTPTTFALGTYNLTSSTQGVAFTIQTPNMDGPINLLAEGSTLYFGFGTYDDNIAPGGEVYSTANLETYQLLYSWTTGFQPESIGYYAPNDTLLISGDGGPNTAIVYKLVNGTATILYTDPYTGDGTFLAMFNSTMVVAGGSFPQTPMYSNNLVNWTTSFSGVIGEYEPPFVFPWSWQTEIIYGKLWMPSASFTTKYPDESGIASFDGSNYNSYPETSASYYSIADSLVGGTLGHTLGNEISFPGPAVISPFYPDGSIGPPIMRYGSGGFAVSSMVYDPATHFIYAALLGQSEKEIVLMYGYYN